MLDVARVIDVGPFDSSAPFIVIELLEGRPLARRGGSFLG